MITLAARAAPKMPTISLASKTAYASTVTNPPKADGSDVSVVARSDSGVDIYIPPALQTGISDAIKGHCAQRTSDECQKAVQAVLIPAMGSLQKRLLVTAGAVALVVPGLFAFVAAVAVLVAAVEIAHLYVAQSDLDQISAAQGASSVVYATASNDASPITVKPTSTAIDTALAATVSIASDNKNGHAPGDLLVLVPGSLGAGLVEAIEGQPCIHKRAIDSTCFGLIASTVLERSGQGGPFEGLLLAIPQLPRDPIAAIAQYLPIIVQNGQNILTLAALTQDQITGLAKIAAIITFAIVILNSNVQQGADVTQFDIPASALSASQTMSNCPPHTRAPDCSNCGSDLATTLFCDGIKTANFHYKGCECFEGTANYFKAFDNIQEISDAQSLLAKITSLTGKTGARGAISTAPAGFPTATITGGPYPPQYVPQDGRYDITVTLQRNSLPYKKGDTLFM